MEREGVHIARRAAVKLQNNGGLFGRRDVERPRRQPFVDLSEPFLGEERSHYYGAGCTAASAVVTLDLRRILRPSQATGS